MLGLGDLGERDFAIDVLHLLNQNLDAIREGLRQRGGAKDFDVDAFTDVFAEHIIRQAEAEHAPPPDREVLRRKLLQLYSNVDCAGRGTLTWDETMMFLIDTTLMGRDTDYIEIMKGYTFAGSLSLTDQSYHTCRVVPQKGKTLVVGRRCELADFSKGEASSAHVSHFPPTQEKVSVLCAEYLGDHSLLVVSLSDLTLRVYETWRGCKQRRSVRLSESFLVLRYATQHSVLYCGSRTGALRAYHSSVLLKADIISDSAKEERQDTPLMYSSTPHTDGITEILVLPDSTVVTCSLDGNVAVCGEDCVVLFTLAKMQRSTTGITRMALLQLGDDGTKFVVTCGFETEARMWLVQNTTSLPFALRDPMAPHTSPVVDVAAVQVVPHIITLDATGVIKVWNGKNWQASQTIKCEAISVSFRSKRWHSICYDADNQRLMALSSATVAFFDYGAAPVVEKVTADDVPIGSMCYDHLRNVVVTASGKTIKSWDALTGRLQLMQADAVESAISALAMSESGRRLYIGTVEGRITCHNAASGVTLRTLSKEGAEVHSIVYGTGRAFVTSMRWDNSVQVYFESEEGVVQGTLSIDPRCFGLVDAKSLAFSDVMNRLAVGDRKGYITLWEAKVRRYEAFNPIIQLQPPEGGIDVVVTAFLTGYPLLASVDANSVVVIWALPPHPQGFTVLARRKIISGKHTITCLAWHWPNALLYAGTSSGKVLVLSLHATLRKAGMAHFCSSLAEMEEAAASPASSVGLAARLSKGGSSAADSLGDSVLRKKAAAPSSDSEDDNNESLAATPPAATPAATAAATTAVRREHTQGHVSFVKKSILTPARDGFASDEWEEDIQVVASTDAHVQAIGFIAVDVLNKCVFTVSDRSAKVFGLGLHSVGGMDQNQKEPYCIRPTYGTAVSAQGDRVLFFRPLTPAELSHPETVLRLHDGRTQHADDADDDAPRPLLRSFFPVAPLPGRLWLGAGPSRKQPQGHGCAAACAVTSEEQLYSRGQHELCAWYAVLGRSRLALGEEEQGGLLAAESKLTQQSFRTPQCNEHLARMRDTQQVADGPCGDASAQDAAAAAAAAASFALPPTPTPLASAHSSSPSLRRTTTKRRLSRTRRTTAATAAAAAAAAASAAPTASSPAGSRSGGGGGGGPLALPWLPETTSQLRPWSSRATSLDSDAAGVAAAAAASGAAAGRSPKRGRRRRAAGGHGGSSAQLRKAESEESAGLLPPDRTGAAAAAMAAKRRLSAAEQRPVTRLTLQVLRGPPNTPIKEGTDVLALLNSRRGHGGKQARGSSILKGRVRRQQARRDVGPRDVTRSVVEISVKRNLEFATSPRPQQRPAASPTASAPPVSARSDDDGRASAAALSGVASPPVSPSPSSPSSALVAAASAAAPPPPPPPPPPLPQRKRQSQSAHYRIVSPRTEEPPLGAGVPADYEDEGDGDSGCSSPDSGTGAEAAWSPARRRWVAVRRLEPDKRGTRQTVAVEGLLRSAKALLPGNLKKAFELRWGEQTTSMTEAIQASEASGRPPAAAAAAVTAADSHDALALVPAAAAAAGGGGALCRAATPQPLASAFDSGRYAEAVSGLMRRASTPEPAARLRAPAGTCLTACLLDGLEKEAALAATAPPPLRQLTGAAPTAGERRRPLSRASLVPRGHLGALVSCPVREDLADTAAASMLSLGIRTIAVESTHLPPARVVLADLREAEKREALLARRNSRALRVEMM